VESITQNLTPNTAAPRQAPVGFYARLTDEEEATLAKNEQMGSHEKVHGWLNIAKPPKPRKSLFAEAPPLDITDCEDALSALPEDPAQGGIFQKLRFVFIACLCLVYFMFGVDPLSYPAVCLYNRSKKEEEDTEGEAGGVKKNRKKKKKKESETAPGKATTWEQDTGVDSFSTR